MQRASHAEIFNRLTDLLGPQAARIAAHLQAGDTETGITLLRDFDETIGGVGIHHYQEGRKLSGTYRALSYSHWLFHLPSATGLTRFNVHSSCAFLEAVLKEMIKLGFLDRLKSNADRLPLGTIIDKAENQLPPDLYQSLHWLSKGIGNFAKHDFQLQETAKPALIFLS